MLKYSTNNRFILPLLAVIAFALPLVAFGQPPPTITTLTPARNALNVAQNSTIAVTFDQSMDAATISDITMVVTGKYTGIIDGSYGTVGSVATFTPTIPFKVGETISVTLTTGIQNASAVALANPEIWAFTVSVQGASDVRRQSISGRLRLKLRETFWASYS